MKQKLTFLSILMLGSASVWAQPTDNPLATHYGNEGYPAWSNEVKWNNVIQMTNQGSGTANFSDFEAKRDILAAQGGGVLYYPAGTYQFTVPDGPSGRGLQLKSGVVIRGEVPPVDDRLAVTTRDVADLADFTKRGLKSNPTKFVFTRLDFNDSVTVLDGPVADKGMVPSTWAQIGCTPADAALVGIVWVEIEYGYIFFGINIDGTWKKWKEEYAYGGTPKGDWLNRTGDGTHPIDFFAGTYPYQLTDAKHGEKRFVFGVHLKNSTISNYMLNKSGITPFDSWKIEPGGWQFGGRLGVYGSHIFVANNCISKPTAWFTLNVKAKAGAGYDKDNPFPADGIVDQVYNYAMCLGIDVNKNLMSGFNSNCMVWEPKKSYYGEDIVVKENYAYSNGNKTYEVAGKWVIVKDNVAAKQYIGYKNVYNNNAQFACNCLMHKSSYKAQRATSNEDYMNRAFDYGGWNFWFHNNLYNGTGSVGNDGEGILCQRHNGVEAYSIAMTYNQQGADGNSGYLAPYDVHVTGLLHGWNEQRGGVGVWNGYNNFIRDCGMIGNINPSYGTASTVSASGTNNKGFLNITECPAPTPGKPVVTLSTIPGAAIIEWTDVTNEVGYAVQRRIKGETDWRNIVFRPRQEFGSVAFFGGAGDSVSLVAGKIKVTGNYTANTAQKCWDSAYRDMNEKKWIDYTVVPGTFEYRVVALACAMDGSDGTSSEIEEVVTGGAKGVPSDAVTFIPVKVYPNPATTSFTIEYSADEATNISLISISGTVIKQIATNDNSGSIQFNTSDLTSGVYFVEVKTATGATRTQLLVK